MKAQRLLPVDEKLAAKLIAEFAAREPKPEPKIYHGPKAARGSPPVVLSDEQVLFIRKLHDWCGLSAARIAALIGEDPMRVRSICRYMTRVHLDPGKQP